MGAVGVAVIVFGPLVAVLLLLAKAVRKLMPQAVTYEAWPPRSAEPPARGDPATDREPRRPLTPLRSGAVRLALPVAPETEADPAPPRTLERRPAGPDHRLAG